MVEEWRPLDTGAATSTEKHDVLHEGVPPWLRRSVLSWVERFVTWCDDWHGSRGWDKDVLLRIERELRKPLPGESADKMGPALMKMLETDSDYCLKVVDYLLATGHPGEDTVVELGVVLMEGASAWTVGKRDGHWGLVRRVDQTVEQVAEQAMAAPGRPGDHLRAAWSALYGQNPDPQTAYDEAVKAVEAAAQPVLLPKDAIATLGKMNDHLKNAAGKYVVAFPATTEADPSTLLRDMCIVLWKGQRWRHGTNDVTVPSAPTAAEAETALHLAVCLVHWFSTGAVRPASP